MDETKYKMWMREARTDLEAGDVLLKTGIYNVAVFNFVQSAEKAVKALLFSIGLQPWGHSISSLLSLYETRGNMVEENIIEQARELERHYITSRYPDALPNQAPSDYYTEQDAIEIKDMAVLILDFVEREYDNRVES